MCIVRGYAKNILSTQGSDKLMKTFCDSDFVPSGAGACTLDSLTFHIFLWTNGLLYIRCLLVRNCDTSC